MNSTRSPQFVESMVLLVTILGTGMVYLDQSAVNVALPAIQLDLHADVGGLQWLIDIYILTLAVLLLIGGALGDRYGRVRVFIVGMALFVGASIAAGLAGSLGLLLLARGLQGVGGALVIPGGFAIINATVAPERRGRVLGTWGAFSPLITISGPLLGGWLVDHVSWRAVFYLNVPLGVAAYVAARFIPENRAEHVEGPLDWPGVVTLTLGLGSLLFGLIEGPNYGWGHPLVVGTLIGGGIGIAAFVALEARSPAPMLPLHLLRNRTFTGINLVTLIHYFGMSSVYFFLTLNLQQVQGYSASLAGLASLPVVLSLILLARPAGHYTDRIGAVPLIAAGIVLNCVGFLMYARPGIDTNYWTSYFPAQVVFGIGLGLLVVPLTAVAIGALENRYSGVASGFNTAVTRMAQMLAVAVFGAVMLSSFQAGLSERTAGLPLETSAREQLMLESRNLGALQPPEGLSTELSQSTRTAIRLAFVDGFRQVMYVSVLFGLVALVALLALVRYPATAQAAAREPAVSRETECQA